MKTDFDRRVARDLKAEKRGKNRVFRIVVCSVLSFLLWISLSYFSFLGLYHAFGGTLEAPAPAPSQSQGEDAPIKFANVDWNEDIFRNERWLERNRQIMFGDASFQQALTAENASSTGKAARLFYDYFNTVIHGDAEAYPSYFTQDYDGRLLLPSAFTMQKLYNIQVLRVDDLQDLDEDTASLKLVNYYVTYEILENNGTFRDDLPSGVATQQIYRLLMEGDELKIHQIVDLRSVDPASIADREPIALGRVCLFGALAAVCVACPFVAWKIYKTRKRKSAQ